MTNDKDRINGLWTFWFSLAMAKNLNLVTVHPLQIWLINMEAINDWTASEIIRLNQFYYYFHNIVNKLVSPSVLSPG